MSVLVVAEHDNQSVKSATLNTVAAAAKIGGDIIVLVAGSNCGAAAKAAAAIAGVKKVLAADAPHYKDQLAENIAPLVVGLAGAYTHVLLPANSFGKNLAPRVAALLDVAQISDIVAVVSADTFVRPIYAGNALATVQSRSSPCGRRVSTRFPQAAARAQSKALRRARIGACPRSSGARSPSPSAPS
jgi:electron transfer flavoprotein alpha subunit